jgi:1A family penicillin-binding protein
MSIGGLVPRAVKSLPRPASFSGAVALTLVLATLGGGSWALYWCGRHAWAIHELRRGVGDTVFFSADGRPWFTLDEQRSDVPLSEVAPHVRQAVVAVEDHRFYRHVGLDPIAMGRAAWRDLRRGELAEGGSTLTQQLARTLFLTNRRTWGRKAKEAVLALMLEQALTKDQILELYLNRVYLSGGVYGVDAMARSLFGKRAQQLGLAESALVAGLIRAPSSLSPWSNPGGAVRRSHVVLARMRAEGYITAEAEQQARRTRLRITAHPRAADARAGYAKEYLRQIFREQVGDEHPPDWQVHTTFVPAIQRAAEEAVARGLGGLDVPGLQAALVALDPHTGDILALVGGSNFASAPYNRAVRSRRQPGSAFKPFVYAAALERGYSPVTVLTGLNSVVAGGREEWAPRNSGGEEEDEQTLREALMKSNNQAAVALQQRIGSGPVRKLGQAAGLRELPDVPSLALGTGLVTPLELTAGFAVFANGGFAVRPRAVVSAFDESGRLAFRIPNQAQRVLSEESAFQTLSLLQDVVDRGTGAGARALGLSIPAAGKTGTTDDFKDAWFVGFSSTIVAGVWVGFDQPAPIGDDAYGARVALPLWVDFMRRAARVRPPEDFEPPAGLKERELCRMSFLRPVDGCPTYVEYFKERDALPDQRCPIHEGSLEERAERAFDELLDAIERKLKNVFKRRDRR